MVKYRVEVKLGGGLKWLGGRMFEGVANKMAVRFFKGVGGDSPLHPTYKLKHQ